MRTRLSPLLCFIAMVVLAAACSSTTQVVREDRAIDTATDESDSTTGSSGDGEAPEASDAAAEEAGDTTPDTADAATDAGRGGRESAGEAPTTPRAFEEASGFGLGGAEQLNSLALDCENGNDMACDILFQLSDFDSNEEITAKTCGGRSEVEVTFCTDGIEAGAGELFFDIESEGLAAIKALCQDDGDMTACDFLFFRSPLDSEFEAIGASCGDRTNVAVPDCRTALARS